MRWDCETKTLVVVPKTKTRIFTNWWITDVGTKINLSCWRRKLLCRLVMQPWILLYVLSDVGRVNRLWPRCDLLHLELINYNWSRESEHKLVIRLVSTRHITTAGIWCLRHRSLTVEFGGRCCSGYFCMFCLDTSLTFTSSGCWSCDADGGVADFCLFSRRSTSFPGFYLWGSCCLCEQLSWVICEHAWHSEKAQPRREIWQTRRESIVFGQLR